MKSGGHHLTLWQVFRVPIGVGSLSVFGLLAALLGDGVWDAVGAGALAGSIVVLAWALVARRR
ncbi:hypothetical protein [uncultured Caulobacter sp.]|uniref:hypothetical protein n=1 Tax=uncultured Caulobacter sp. TaxID=158749 RepID=UPI00261D3D6A|nr:hypothetical protein [uncultured Caulobacter sp.]